MSRLISSCLALGLVAALAAPVPIIGQQTDQELVSKLDSLVPLLPQARKAASDARERQAREREAANGTLDTIMVGPLRVLVFPGQADVARDVMGSVWDRDFAGWVRDSPSLARHAFFFQWAPTLRPFLPPHQNVTKIEGTAEHDSRAYMEAGARRAISAALQWDLHGTPWMDWWTPAPTAPDRLYRTMALTPSKAVRSCMAGSPDGCLSATDLQVDDYPLDDWYTPDERADVIKAHLSLMPRGTDRNACWDGDISGCDALLKANGRDIPYAWLAPLSRDLKSSLLSFALHKGGDGAWSRLRRDPDASRADALAAAAGAPASEVVMEWRAWLFEHRPVANADLGTATAVAVFWILLLSTLAMRSTRWRLG